MSKEQIKVSVTDLLDLVPESASISLGGKDYTLRRFELNDEAWLGRKFGERVEKIFSELRMPEICQIIFHQLEDKASFVAFEEDGYDDDGNPCKVKITGPEQVMRGISGKRHQFDAIAALLKTIGWSKPLLDEEEIKKHSSKKKSKVMKKTRKKRTGRKSSTS